MKVTAKDVRDAGFSEATVERLRAMSLGGGSGAGGYRYQTRYIVSKLIEAVAARRDGVVAMYRIMEQGFGFVDDVQIEDGEITSFCQLKTSKNIVWHAARDRSRRNKLLQEFLDQAKLLRKLGVEKNDFELLLVTPHEDAVERLMGDPIRREGVPRGLKYCVRVELFPHVAGRHSSFLLQHEPTRDALDKLCAIEPTSSIREQLYAAFDSTWSDLSCAGEYILLDEVVSELRQNQALPLYHDDVEVSSNWDEARRVLEAIPDLRVELVGGFCQYWYRYQRGHIPARSDSWAFEQFVSRVLQLTPDSFESFKELLGP